MSSHVIPFEQLRNTDVGSVGGKNASLGEMISQLHAKGVRVPTGFATTADAYRTFLAQNGLDKKINAELDALNADDTQALAKCGAKIRGWIMEAEFPADLKAAIAENYAKLTESSAKGTTFAVRSSATAEDLPDASFAGQQETYLNVQGIAALLDTCRRCWSVRSRCTGASMGLPTDIRVWSRRAAVSSPVPDVTPASSSTCCTITPWRWPGRHR